MTTTLRLRQTYPAWIGIAISFYAFIVVGMVQSGLGVLLPSILKTFHLTPAAVTPLFISQFTGYVVAALNSNLLSSRLGLARMLLLAALNLGTALSIYAFTPQWNTMLVGGVLFGLGIGLIDAGVNNFIIGNHRNANLMGFLHAFCGIGALMGPTIATTLLSQGITWRLVYVAFTALVGILVGGLVWAIVSDYKPMTMLVSASNSKEKADFRVAFKNPTLLLTGLFLLVYVGTEASLGNWAYTLQTVTQGISPAMAGYSLSGYWLGLSLGRLGMGPVVRRLGAVRTITCSLALLLVGITIWWLLPGQIWSLMVVGIALAAIFPTTMWLVPQRLPCHMVSTAIGFLASVGNLGAAVVPSLVGWIAGRVGLKIIPGSILFLVVVMIVLHLSLNANQTSSCAGSMENLKEIKKRKIKGVRRYYHTASDREPNLPMRNNIVRRNNLKGGSCGAPCQKLPSGKCPFKNAHFKRAFGACQTSVTFK